MHTWHCTDGERHLPHTWYYRKIRRWFRCDGQPLSQPKPERSNQWSTSETE